MEKPNVLAHRGWWFSDDEKNSFLSLQRALEAGFGVETDLREQNGRLVISHDPPKEEALDAEAFFELYVALRVPGRLALNIKADGLQKPLLEMAARTCIPMENVYVFDMSVPDALGYFSSGFPAYTRISDYEESSSFLARSAGVWVDNFVGDFPQVAEAARLVREGYRACIVSPELHGRSPWATWAEIAEMGLHRNPLFEICTDMPKKAYELFGPIDL